MSTFDPLSPEPRLPTRREAWWFECRAACFRTTRAARNGFDRAHRRYRAAPRETSISETIVPETAGLEMIAESASRLWPQDGAQEQVWALGKVENLRVARRAFDGVALRTGQVLSFWAQLGKPSCRRGFVIGRELREGCLIPSVGGGLCQLSNALYAAALEAGLEIVERHAHTRTIPGSQAARDRDATVFWNYVDLRLRAPFPCRLEVEMDADTLRVRIRAEAAAVAAVAQAPRGLAVRTSAAAETQGSAAANDRDAAAATHTHGDCGRCGMTACFRHAPETPRSGRRRLLADALSAEERAYFETSAEAQAGDAQRLIAATPLPLRLRARADALSARLRKAAVGERLVAQAQWRARAARAALRPEHVELDIDQAWLPWLWRDGALAGRRFRVLMRGLPMAALHTQLDAAAARHPNEPTLRDFRAAPWLVEAETQALAAAEAWLSAHAGVLALAGAKARALAWRLPQTPQTQRMPMRERAPGPLRVYFPASSLVRKGALELAAALRAHGDAELLLPARDGGDATRWHGIALRRIADPEAALDACDAVALPAWVEQQPRALLAAIVRGVPVVATATCGLGALPGWRCVAEGDVAGLTEALRTLPESSREPPATTARTAPSAIAITLLHAADASAEP